MDGRRFPRWPAYWLRRARESTHGVVPGFAAEQTQAIDRSHRIGQTEPVTAWRIIAAQTIDAKIAELIDSKAGLAAAALDGSEEEIASSADVQHEALVALLTDALSAERLRLDS